MALAIGRGDWQTLQEELTPAEMDGWEAFDRIEGIRQLTERRMAHMLSTTIKAWTGEDFPAEAFLAEMSAGDFDHIQDAPTMESTRNALRMALGGA